MTESEAGASPKSIRYYYPASRAHHAYCMAVDFGMEFEQRSGKWPLEGLKHIDPASSYRIYVHTGSVDLLEPLVGDLLTSGEEIRNSIAVATLTDLEKCGVGIIQRNGLAFHWPEREAA